MSGNPTGNDLDRSVYIRRRIMVVLIIMALGGLLFYDPTREFMKITILIGMPALVAWRYQQKYQRYSLPWIMFSLVLVGFLIGYGFLLKGLPDKIGWRGAQRQGDVLLSSGMYDQAINEYKEMARYGKKDKMEAKIRTAMQQKQYDASYRKAKALVDSGQYEQARSILAKIPYKAIVHRQARDLLADIENK